MEGYARPARRRARRRAGARGAGARERDRRARPRPSGGSTTRGRRSRPRCRGCCEELVRCLSCRRRCRPRSARSASSSPRRSAPTATTSGARCRSACRSRSSTQLSLGHSATMQMVVLFAFGAAVRGGVRLGLHADARTRGRRRCAFVCAHARSSLPVPFLIRARRAAGRSRGSRCSGSRCRPRWSSASASATRSRAGASSALADYVHALGSLAALIVVVGVSELTLISLLHSQGDNGQRVAHAPRRPRAQPAALPRRRAALCRPGRRVGSRRIDRRRRRDADLHPPLDADAAGRPDPQVEP